VNSCFNPGRRVAIVGGGPGGISAALSFLARGYDVRLFERAQALRPLGGAVLLSTPVLAVLRSFGIDVDNNFGRKTVTHFANHKGKTRATLAFNKEVEERFGIEGWHYGILRSNAYDKMMLALHQVDPGCTYPGHKLQYFTENPDSITLHFENGEEVEADLLVGADGINSVVSRQVFGDPRLFHIGLRVWLAWCEDIPGIDRENGYIHHSRNVQASYFPMKHGGKPGFEWWVVERSNPDRPAPADVETHLRSRLREFPAIMTKFADHTDFSTQVFPWEIYNRSSLEKWSKGRVVCLGDAVHPVSPYAAYGMGMAIEDGYFLARAFRDKDLGKSGDIRDACQVYENDRVAYVNHHVEFARSLGNRFHKLPPPLAYLRDLVFDNTKLLHRLIARDYQADAEKMSLALTELHRPRQEFSHGANPGPYFG
jgi:2-polyprenyl-6-methoxyphenol hydroxylase-like FAD-dependent oxidoreductase